MSQTPFCFPADSYETGTIIKLLSVHSLTGCRKGTLMQTISMEYSVQMVFVSLRKFLSFPIMSSKCCYYLLHCLPSLLRAFPFQLIALLKLTALQGLYQHWSFSSGRQLVPLNSQLQHLSLKVSTKISGRSLYFWIHAWMQSVLFQENPNHFASIFLNKVFWSVSKIT